MIADDRYSARDALELIDVEYEVLEPVVDALPRARPGRAGDPRRPRRPDRQPRVRLGGRRRGRHRGGVRACRLCRRAGAGVPALASGADGDVRRRRLLRPRRRAAHAVVHDPGASRAPDLVFADHRPAGAPHPRDLAGRRRRLRQQGAGLSRLRLRDGRRDGDRAAREVDGGPVREPDVDRVRARLRDEGPDRGHSRGPHPGCRRRRDRRPRRVQRGGSAFAVPRRLLQHLHRLLRHRGRALLRDRRLHEQGAGRDRLRVLVPDRRGGLPGRADRRLPRARAGDGPGRAAAAEPVEARPVPVRDEHRLGLRLRRLRARAADGAGDRGL